MSATMARQEGRVQLEQSDMHLAFNMAKMANEGFRGPQWTKRKSYSRNLGLKSKKRRCSKWSFRGMTMWRLWWKDTRLCLEKIKRTAAFLANMAQHRIPRNTGGAKAWVTVQESNWESRHQNRRHICLERHQCHLVTMKELTYLNSKVCHPDMCIWILLFPALNFSLLMHMPRIASAIKILIQICWLMGQYPLVSTLSAVW